ncbi:MAG: RNA polymerase sigma factor [Bacteroidota bacterium]
MTERAFKELILPLTERIYPMVARILNNDHRAEDAVQDIMLKVWDHRSKLDNHPNPSGYVFLMARNYCLDLLRKKSLKMHPLDHQTVEAGTTGGSSSLEQNELFELIESILKELPEPQGEILKLHDIDGFKYGEIAGILNLKVEYVRVLLFRARRSVSIKLKTVYDYE